MPRGISQESIPSHRSIFWRYGFAWVTGAVFLVTLSGHRIFGWFAYAAEQRAHNQPVSVSERDLTIGSEHAGLETRPVSRCIRTPTA
jgi:hypothetical protein